MREYPCRLFLPAFGGRAVLFGSEIAWWPLIGGAGNSKESESTKHKFEESSPSRQPIMYPNVPQASIYESAQATPSPASAQDASTNSTTVLFSKQIQALQDAGKCIESSLHEDEQFPELWDLFTNAAATSMEYAIDLRNHYATKSITALPEALLEQYRGKIYGGDVIETFTV